jgi:hypothetical protein
MAQYVPNATPTTADIHQLERYLREEYEEVRGSTDDIYVLSAIVRELYQIAGYGQIGLDAVTPLANIGATYQQLPFDVELITDPRGVVYNLAGDGMLLTEEGVWSFFAKVSLEFLEAQAGRRIQLSLWDTTNNIAIGPEFNFSIGRNTDGANLSFQIMFDITALAATPIGLAVRSTTDTFTGVSAIGSIFGVNYQSEYRGDFFNDTRLEVASRWP